MVTNTIQLFLTLYLTRSLLENVNIEFESKVIVRKKYVAVLKVSPILQHQGTALAALEKYHCMVFGVGLNKIDSSEN